MKYIGLLLLLISMTMNVGTLSAKGLIYFFSIENKTTPGYEIAKDLKIGSLPIRVLFEEDSKNKHVTLEQNERYQFKPPLLVMDLKKNQTNSKSSFQLIQEYLAPNPKGDFFKYRELFYLTVENNKLILNAPSRLGVKNPSYENTKLKEKDLLVNIILTNNGPIMKVIATDSLVSVIATDIEQMFK